MYVERRGIWPVQSCIAEGKAVATELSNDFLEMECVGINSIMTHE